MQPQEAILIVDFGSQFTQLIARKVRESKVYCVVVPCTTQEMPNPKDISFRGIILSGGPASVHYENAPQLPNYLVDMLRGGGNGQQQVLPILGICYGQQAICHTLGGKVEGGEEGHAGEYGRAKVTLLQEHSLLRGVFAQGENTMHVWMSHTDRVTNIPQGFVTLGSSPQAPFAIIANNEKKVFGVQFHPEVVHTPKGTQLLLNFLKDICSCAANWSMQTFMQEAMTAIQTQVGNRRVLCALSGGVDSTTLALLLHKAIPDQLDCMFVDTGLLRHEEAKNFVALYQKHFPGIKLHHIDASQQFLAALSGVSDPEQKRKIIGKTFIEVFEAYADKLPNRPQILAQGTLYPDVIESVSYSGGPSDVIKSHHNVGGLPDFMRMELLEPLRSLFKDEVRSLAKELGLPETFIGRHPFPGPGLAVRILGEVTQEKITTLQKADAVFIEEIRHAGLYDEIWQAFVVLLPVKTVGTMGDSRTYENVCALRAVTSQDGMTADFYSFSMDFLGKVSSRIVNEVKGINRVTYDITGKPPGTIEWE